MFQRYRLFQSSLDKKIAKETDQNATSQLIKQREYTPTAFFNDVSLPRSSSRVHFFVKIVIVIERLFSKMKLIKIRLRNQLGQLSLDSLLHISIEGQEKFRDKYKFFC